MELQQLSTMLQPMAGVGAQSETFGYNVTAYIQAIQEQWKPLFENEAYKEFDVDFHKIITDKKHRKDKKVFAPTGQKNADGTQQTEMEIVKVARLPVSLQKIIVGRATQFLTGGKITLDCNPVGDAQTALLAAVNQTWKNNKLQFKNGKIATAMMSQLECAELWYSDEDKKGKPVLRMNILTPVLGFTFKPVFDAVENLIAFGIGWADGNGNEYFDLYTDEEKRSHVKTKNGVWELDADFGEGTGIVQHGYGKIPVIYYTQLKAEWHPVQRLIERYEFLISNFADINDYNGSPVLFLKGKGMSLPSKGTAGKVLQSEDGDGDAKYVTWEQAPEAIALELNTLLSLIYSMTQTAPIDFENMKGLGQLSGVAFDRILIDSHLKAREKQNDSYGECIQRRINFLLAALPTIIDGLESDDELDITPTFDIFRIDDEADRLALIIQANGGKPVISQETSIKLSGMVDVEAAEDEWNKITAEKDTLGAVNDSLVP